MAYGQPLVYGHRALYASETLLTSPQQASPRSFKPLPEVMVTRAREMYSMYLDLKAIAPRNLWAFKQVHRLEYKDTRLLEYIVKESGGQRGYYPVEVMTNRTQGDDTIGKRLGYLRRCLAADVSGEDSRRLEQERQDRRKGEEETMSSPFTINLGPTIKVSTCSGYDAK